MPWTESQAPKRSWHFRLPILVVATLAYYGIGRLGLSFAQTNQSVSLIWPPSGFALALTLLLGAWLWPALLAGAFLFNLATTGQVTSSIGIAAGNTLEALVGAYLITRFAAGRDVFRRGQDILKFVVACGVSTAISSSFGVTSLALTHLAPARAFATLWLDWWVGDLGGDLVVAPAVLLWGLNPRVQWRGRQVLEVLLSFVGVVVVAQTVFGGLSWKGHSDLPITFLSLPILIWIGFRLGQRESATAVLIMSAIAVRATAQGLGPFATMGKEASLLLLSLYTCVVSLTSMVLASVVSYHRRIEEAVRNAYGELGLRLERQRGDLSRAINALKASVKARMRAERYAEAIVKTISEPLLLLDSEFRIRAANPAFHGLFRIRPEEADRRQIFQLGNRQWDICDLRVVLEDILASGRVLEGYPLEHEFPGIGPRTLLVNARPVLLEDAPGPHVLLAFQDVTLRKQAEDALRMSEERFRTVAETAVDAIISANRRGEIIFFNRTAEQIFGYEASEVMGCSLEVLMPDRYRTSHRQSLERYVTTGDPRILGRTIELTGVRKDGSEFPVELSVTSWKVREDVFFTAIARDVTERKEADRMLRERELQLARAQALAHVGSWTWEVRKHRVRGSSELFRIHFLEPRPEPVSPQLFFDTIHPQDRKAFQKDIERTLRRREPLDCEYRIVGPQGAVRWLHGCAELAFGPEGLTVVGTAQDITERKRADQRIRQLNAELERRVQERTAELENSNLELQQFAYIAAHDLQEPLRTVAAYTQLLARRYRGQLDSDADEFIGFATDGAQWMHQLIDDLLLYSRVGSGSLRCESTECAAIVKRALNNLQRSIEETNALIICDKLPSIVADKSQLVLLFQNLIGNAIKFRGEKRPEIHVCAERAAGGWKFAIRDNGMGIETKHLGRIFAIFQRLHVRGQFPGTGIGLAICKRIVERHGGRIDVESRIGHGSTFWFNLPDQVPESRAEAMKSEPEAAAAIP